MLWVLPLVVAVLVVMALVKWLSAAMMASAARRRSGSARPGGYEFDRRTDQVRRDLKRVGGRPSERRGDIVAWLDSHAGVEAYMEPKTVMSPLSVVLVDGDGVWKRFELGEDRFLRQVAKERGLAIFDAGRTGYPPRMRRGTA
jgi:hypothetical protein